MQRRELVFKHVITFNGQKINQLFSEKLFVLYFFSTFVLSPQEGWTHDTEISCAHLKSIMSLRRRSSSGSLKHAVAPVHPDVKEFNALDELLGQHSNLDSVMNSHLEELNMHEKATSNKTKTLGDLENSLNSLTNSFVEMKGLREDFSESGSMELRLVKELLCSGTNPSGCFAPAFHYVSLFAPLTQVITPPLSFQNFVYTSHKRSFSTWKRPSPTHWRNWAAFWFKRNEKSIRDFQWTNHTRGKWHSNKSNEQVCASNATWCAVCLFFWSDPTK